MPRGYPRGETRQGRRCRHPTVHPTNWPDFTGLIGSGWTFVRRELLVGGLGRSWWTFVKCLPIRLSWVRAPLPEPPRTAGQAGLSLDSWLAFGSAIQRTVQPLVRFDRGQCALGRFLPCLWALCSCRYQGHPVSCHRDSPRYMSALGWTVCWLHVNPRDVVLVQRDRPAGFWRLARGSRVNGRSGRWRPGGQRAFAVVSG